MSTAALLAAVSAVAGLATLHELVADYGERFRERLAYRARRLPDGIGSPEGAARALDVSGRLRRAGLDGAIDARAVLAAKGLGAGAGAVAWAFAGSALPLRAALILLVLCMLGGFLAPDVILERRARARAWTLRAELADALDLIALEVSAGVSIPRALASAAAQDDGPLAAELGRAVAALEAGEPAGKVLGRLGEQAAVPELSVAGRALERSHRLGGPLGDELRAQASSLRRERARAIRESADRAGPKIQLVVALVLVPAALLIIAAALVAHGGSLLGGL